MACKYDVQDILALHLLGSWNQGALDCVDRGIAMDFLILSPASATFCL